MREGLERRNATYDDFENLVRLAQSFPQLDSPGGTICEPDDKPLDSRHLDMVYALLTLSDKPFMGSVTSAAERRSTRSRWRRWCSARSRSSETPAIISLINVNSPLRYDDRMLGALHRVREARTRPTIVTPFLLMGAMSPVSVPATLAQQVGEALAGIALVQTIRPGLPRRLRLVPLEHRHAVGLAELRHAGVGGRPALHRADRAPLQAAVPRRRRAHLVAGRRRAGRATSR